VRTYAEIFGGDPHNVTVVGGSDVCAQLTSPSARGLFDKAIMETSSCLTYWPAGLLRDHSAAGSPFVDQDHVARLGVAAARKAGCSHDVLHCVERKDGLSGFDFWAYGSPKLPAQPAAALRTGHYWPVPVLASVRPDYDGDVDAAALTKAFGNDAATVAAHYPPESRGKVANDSVWACPMLETARIMAAKKPVYVYESEDRPLSAWSRFAGNGTTGWDAYPHVRGATDHQCAFWATITVA
jgi:para-nitrobenzyl esterase